MTSSLHSRPRFKILVAEADHSTRLIFQTLNLEWDVRFVDSGTKVMQQLNTFLPDLVIVDAEMKGGAADLVARAIKQSARTRSIPIVFISAHCDAKCVDYHRRAGADYMVLKPLTYEKLQDIVHDILLTRGQPAAGTESPTIKMGSA